jgi:hypothetical protein
MLISAVIELRTCQQTYQMYQTEDQFHSANNSIISCTTTCTHFFYECVISLIFRLSRSLNLPRTPYSELENGGFEKRAGVAGLLTGCSSLKTIASFCDECLRRSDAHRTCPLPNPGQQRPAPRPIRDRAQEHANDGKRATVGDCRAPRSYCPIAIPKLWQEGFTPRLCPEDSTPAIW